jgi:branched-chain amino acid transport system permease protein
MGQILADGVVSGALIGLGAIGLTLTYSILGFANFTHGEFVTWGAYSAWFVTGLVSAFLTTSAQSIGALSFGWPLIGAALAAMIFTAIGAWILDLVVFQRLRRRGNAIIMVIASFGASLALRNFLEFIAGSRPVYFSQEIQVAVPFGLGIRLTPDQLFALLAAAILLATMHTVLTKSPIGRSMRAVSENSDLAKIAGVDVAKVIRATWLFGGALAGGAGIMLGILVQVRPDMGFDLLLPLFAAAILGGIGSVPGAVAGGLFVGVSEALSVQFIGANYRAAVAFLLLITVLLIKPTGLFGQRQ